MIRLLCTEMKCCLDRGGGKGGTGLHSLARSPDCFVVIPKISTFRTPASATCRNDNKTTVDRKQQGPRDYLAPYPF